ncbi:MAG: HlyC/CorC family transporter [Rhodospirillales bacterium]|nr:HlyC/CorC family transporter [Rhodospirillales bacterium]
MRDWLKGLVKAKSVEPSALETLEELIEERQESETPIDPHERALLGNVLRLRDVSAADVMVPRADIVAVPASMGLDELLAYFTREGHSRMPVYRGTLDDVIGMVHIKDLLAWVKSGQPFQMNRILRKVLFVAPSARVLDLLMEMRQKRTHLAVVVDEYGGIDGLMTIEDVVEQIVGEIEDEHDLDSEPEIRRLDERTLEADARAPVENLETMLDRVLLSDEEREDIDTLGGLVTQLAGRVPGRGEIITHGAGIEFEILEADPRRVRRLRLRLPPDSGEDAGA